MDEEIRFYLSRDGAVTGPVTDDELRDSLRRGAIEPDVRVRLAGSDLWTSPRAFATFARRQGSAGTPRPGAPIGALSELPADLAAAPAALRDMLLFWVHEAAHTFGPLTGEQLRRGFGEGHYRTAAASLVDSATWYPVSQLVAAPGRASAVSVPTSSGAILLGAAAPIHAESAAPVSALPASISTADARCPTCLEHIAASVAVCSECGEPVNVSARVGPGSIPDDRPDASWLAMHWRPLVTMGAIASLVCAGIALRYLAPGRFSRINAKPAGAAITPAACTSPCWNGEACELGRCVWQKPNDVGHVGASSEPMVGGPFALPKDVSDAIPLDGERFAVSLLTGLEVRNARTGGMLGLVTEAMQARRLYRVGSVVYATAPSRIYVIDAATTRILKTIELGAAASEVTVGASGRRALASLPTAHAIAVLATEYHAEIDRIQFGDDPVGPVGTDDSGKRALTTTGQVPLPGLPAPSGGAVYAFDPSRLASAQDRVRASMVGNPVSVLMTPGGETSYVVLRAEDAVVPLEWLPSGAVRQEGRISTCREPEQIELVRRERRAIVRCNEGRAIEVFDLGKQQLLRHVPFNARVADLAVSPDGRQAIVALPAEGNGFIGIVDLETFVVKVLPVTAEPTRVRLSPDGSMALVLSDRAKVVWVIR